MLQVTDPAVQAAIITSAGSVFASVVAATCAAFIGQQFARRKQLQEKLEQSTQDVQFLLEVEKAHCEMHRERDGESNKIRVRTRVREKGYAWTGKFTPGA